MDQLADGKEAHRDRPTRAPGGLSRGRFGGTVRTALGSIWVHGAALAVLLVILIPTTSSQFIALVDEGVYTAQAANLSDGSWAAPRPLPEIDASGRFNPLLAPTKDDSWIPYARQPLYPVLLSPVFAAGGYQSLLVVSALGTWIAAMNASGLAGLVRRKLMIPTLWLTAVGTPLLFDAYVVNAHSLAAAAGSACALGVMRFATPETNTRASTRLYGTGWLLLAILSAVLLVLLRSEGAILIGSLAFTGCLLAISFKGYQPKINYRLAGPCLFIGVTGIITYLLNEQWSLAISSTPGTTSASIARQTDPLHLLWASILRPWSDDNRSASSTMFIVLASIIIAGLAIRLKPRWNLLGLGLLWVAAATAVIRGVYSTELVSGLLPTIPAVVLGLLLLGTPDLNFLTVRFLLGSSAFAAIAILWTAYGIGGGTEWGGRFFHILIPFLTPLAVAALDSMLAVRSTAYRRWLVSAVIVLTAAISLASLRALADQRQWVGSLVESTVQIAEQSPNAIVAVATLNDSGTSRVFWEQSRRGFPILNGGSLSGLGALLPQADAAGRSEVLVITNVDPPTLETIVNRVQQTLKVTTRWSVTRVEAVGNTGLVALTLNKDSSDRSD